MDNGIEFHKLQSDKFKTKTVNVFFCDELTNERASYNSLLATVLKRGTCNYPSARDISIREQELYDARVYTDIDKKGEIQVASFAVSVVDEKYISESSDLFNNAIDLLFEVITNPVLQDNCFNSSYVEQEKSNLCDLIESKINDKAVYSSFRCFEEMCAGEAYSIDEMGNIEFIKSIDCSNLYHYYKEIFLKRLPVKIFMTGSLSEDNIAYVKNKFNVFRQRDVFQIKETGKLIPARQSIKNVTENMNVLQGKLCIGFRTMTNAHSDDYYALAICNTIFGGGTESKLFQNVRERESLAYYAFSRIDRFKGLMIVSAGIESNNKDMTQSLILQQLEDIKNGKISEEEFQAAINSYINAVNQMNDGQRTLSEFFLGNILSDNNDTLEEIINKVKKITKADVVQASKKIKADTVYFLTGKE